MTILTAADRNHVRQAINRARKAQIEAAGGYTAVERDARTQDKDLGASPIDRLDRLERERDALNRKLRAVQTRETRKAGEIHDLRAELRRVRNQLYHARAARGLWYTRATGHEADKGRGATRLRSVA